MCHVCSQPMAQVKQTLHLAMEALPQRYKSYVQWNLLYIFLKMTLQRPASKNYAIGGQIPVIAMGSFTQLWGIVACEVYLKCLNPSRCFM